MSNESHIKCTQQHSYVSECMSPNNCKYKLTIGVTTYYKTDFERFKMLIYSMLDPTSLCDRFSDIDKSKAYIEHINSDINSMELIDRIDEPVELIVFIDRLNDEPNSNVNSIVNFVKSIHVNNLTVRVLMSTENVRVSVARNAIIQLGLGTYLIFRDDDDLCININESLRLINQTLNTVDHSDAYSHNESITYMESFMMNFNKEWSKLPVISLMSSCIVVVNRQFLIDNNLVYPPDVGNEDTIWRNDLYWLLMQQDGFNNARLIKASTYLYYERSDRSIATSLNPFVDDITAYFDIEMRDNNNAYSIIDKVMQHELLIHHVKIPIIANLFRSINIIASVRRSWSVIREYMIRHKQYYEIEDYINMITQIDSIELDFWQLTDNQQTECFEMFCIYSSLSDMYHFVRELVVSNKLDNNIEQINSSVKCHQDNEIDSETNYSDINSKVIPALDVMFKWKGSLKYMLNRFGKFNSKQLNKFVYKYICMLWIRADDQINSIEQLYGNKLNKKLLTDIKLYMSNYLRSHNMSEVVLYLHGTYIKHAHCMEMTPESYRLNEFVKYMGKIDFKLNVMKSLKDVMSEDDYEYVKNGINEYVAVSNIRTCNTRPKYMPGTYLDVLLGLLIAPDIREGSVNHELVIVNRQNDLVDLVDGINSVNRWRMKRGNFDGKICMVTNDANQCKSLSGGFNDTSSLPQVITHDICSEDIRKLTVSNSIINYVVLGIALMLCIVLIVIIMIIYVRNRYQKYIVCRSSELIQTINSIH